MTVYIIVLRLLDNYGEKYHRFHEVGLKNIHILKKKTIQTIFSIEKISNNANLKGLNKNDMFTKSEHITKIVISIKKNGFGFSKVPFHIHVQEQPLLKQGSLL